MLERNKSVDEMSDEEVLYWANAQQDTLDHVLSWAGWGFPHSAIPRVKESWYATRERIAAANREARKRGLI